VAVQPDDDDINQQTEKKTDDWVMDDQGGHEEQGSYFIEIIYSNSMSRILYVKITLATRHSITISLTILRYTQLVNLIQIYSCHL